MTEVKKRDILVGLKKIGLKKGDHVIVHVAMSSFGKVTGGAKTVIEAIAMKG